MTKKISPRVVKIKRRGFDSIRLSIVHRYRNFHGKSVHDTLWQYKTIRSNETDDFDVQKEFHNALDNALLRLILQGHLRPDCDTIRDRFTEIVPKPNPAHASLTAPAKPTTKSTLSEIQ